LLQHYYTNVVTFPEFSLSVSFIPFYRKKHFIFQNGKCLQRWQ